MSVLSEYPTGSIVRSLAGRDKGGLLCVVGADPARGCLLLADGKGRKLARPKAKRPRHIALLSAGANQPAAGKPEQGRLLTDKELRRTLSAFRNEMEA